MRYLLTKENEQELISRKDFLFEVFNVWFMKSNRIGDFIVFESMPMSVDNDICLIYGHNYEIYDLLKKHRKEIYEKNIFIITCEKNYENLFRVPNKNVYLAPQTNGYIELRNGLSFGFDFDISDIELNLYNSPIKQNKHKLKELFTQI